MIEFNCVCKQYKFSLPPEMAGSLIQCPTCRRLVDVPTLGELAQIDEDGGYKFEGESKSKELDTKMAMRAFSSQRVDEFGQEIDLRNTYEEIQRAGVHHLPGTLDGVRPIPPKYDPVTGELIRPLPIKNEMPQRVLPVEPESDEPLDAVPIPPPKLHYSVVPSAKISLGAVFIVLFQPANVVVMGAILLLTIFAHAAAVVTAIMIFPFIIPIILLLALVGHYGNVIDEVGPSGRDELPTPLRNISFGEDMWNPFCQITIALFIAFLPAALSTRVAMPNGAREVVELICTAAGCLVAPALVLTAVTSGTYHNLRPDRVAGVIGCCGYAYGTACLTFAAAAVVYGVAFGLMAGATATLLQLKSITAGLSQLGSAYVVLAGAIYLAHAFCWQMGLLYRTYHDRFPWILQRHIKVRMAERTRSRTHPGHLPPIS